jgi:hypothetical protein
MFIRFLSSEGAQGENGMNTRSHCLSTAAGLALALALSAPAFSAEMGPNGPQESTPAEKAQTQTLNQQQQGGTYVNPSVANGAAPAPGAAPAEGVAAAVSQTPSTDAQYQARVDRYHAQQDQYLAQRDAYEHQRAAYEWQRRHPASWWHYRYTNASLNSFYSLDRPALINASVTDRDGFLVGHISEVVRASSGRVIRVLVSIGPGRGAWIEARNMRYFRGDGLIMVDLSPGQIWERSMPI